MKKIILLSLLILTLVGCSNTIKTTKSNFIEKNQTYSFKEEGSKRWQTMVISKISNVTNDEEIEKILKPALTTEFSNAGYVVLDRDNLKELAKEDLFNNSFTNSVGGYVGTAFKKADWIVEATISRSNFGREGYFTIIWNKEVTTYSATIDIKLVNVVTGEVRGAVGEAKSQFNGYSLLFLGNFLNSYSSMREEALRLAIIDAIEKLRM